MADPPKRKVKVIVREIVEDVKSGMKQEELVLKHGISSRALASVTEKILRAGYVSRLDLHPTLVSAIRAERLAKESGPERTLGNSTLRLPESLMQSLPDSENIPDSVDPTMNGSLPTRDDLTSIILKALSENLPDEQELLKRIDQALMTVMPSEKSIGSQLNDTVTRAILNDDLIRKELRTSLVEQLPDKEEILNAIAASFVFVLPDTDEMLRHVVSHVTGSLPSKEKISNRVDEYVGEAFPSRDELFQRIDEKLSALVPDAEAAEGVLGGALAAFEMLDRIRKKADKVLADVSAMESTIDKLVEATGTVPSDNEVAVRSQGTIAQAPSLTAQSSGRNKTTGPEGRYAQSAEVPLLGAGPKPPARGGPQVRLSLDDMGMLDFDEDDGFEPTIELDAGAYRKWTPTAGPSGDGDHGFSEPSEGPPPHHNEPYSFEGNLRDTVTIDLGADDSLPQREEGGHVQMETDEDEIDLTMSMEGDSIYSEIVAANGEKRGESESDVGNEYAATHDTSETVTRELESTIALPGNTPPLGRIEPDFAIQGMSADEFSDDHLPTEELSTAEFPIIRRAVGKPDETDPAERIVRGVGDSPQEPAQELEPRLPQSPTNEAEVDE
jgi:hypothetical protein